MRNQKGFEVIQLMIFLIFVAVLTDIGFDLFHDDNSEPQKTARIAAENFIERNGIDVKELVCGEAADLDGHAICKILTQNEEDIILNCPSELSEVSECEETKI